MYLPKKELEIKTINEHSFQKRFRAGNFLIISENVQKGNIHYYSLLDEEDESVKEGLKHRYKENCYLLRGELFSKDTADILFLIKDPELVLFREDDGWVVNKQTHKAFEKTRKIYRWKLRFMLDNKIYYCFLTNKEFHHKIKVANNATSLNKIFMNA